MTSGPTLSSRHSLLYPWDTSGYRLRLPYCYRGLLRVGINKHKLVSQDMAQLVDEEGRILISATPCLLSALKEIKTRGLLPAGSSRIQGLGMAELHSANCFRRTIVWSLVLAYTQNFISPVVTFLAFILPARANGTRFDATRAFTSPSILIILTHPLAATLQGIPLLQPLDLWLVNAFLRTPDLVDIRTFPLNGSRTATSPPKPAIIVAGDVIEMELQNIDNRFESSVHTRPVVFRTFEANLGWNEHDVLRNVSILVP
jgi:hypothetical protein